MFQGVGLPQTDGQQDNWHAEWNVESSLQQQGATKKRKQHFHNSRHQRLKFGTNTGLNVAVWIEKKAERSKNQDNNPLEQTRILKLGGKHSCSGRGNPQNGSKSSLFCWAFSACGKKLLCLVVWRHFLLRERPRLLPIWKIALDPLKDKPGGPVDPRKNANGHVKMQNASYTAEQDGVMANGKSKTLGCDLLLFQLRSNFQPSFTSRRQNGVKMTEMTNQSQIPAVPLEINDPSYCDTIITPLSGAL